MNIPEDLRWKPTGKPIGQGGQASVIEVKDAKKEHPGVFALKALSKDKPQKAYERFYREIEAIKKIDHPSVVKIIDHSTEKDDFQYYVMEYIPNSTPLKSLLHTNNNPYHKNAQKAAKLFLQLAEAIREWSEKQIIHRDLSPSNVLILPNEKIKVIDFGICQKSDGDTITLTDESVGTHNYMAPECESGVQADVTFASDLYSAGKVMWSAIANQKAFSREKPAFATKSMQSMFPENPETWHLHHIFEKTIRNIPSNRFQLNDAIITTSLVLNLIQSGKQPLEHFGKRCPSCGFGTLGEGQNLHEVFGNPNPKGVESSQCNYCGICYAINTKVITAQLAQRQKLE